MPTSGTNFSQSSVNAKQLEQPVFQAGPNRCESDHGCQWWLNASCPRSSDRLERRSAKAEVTGAIPVVDTISALVPQQPQGGFRKPVFVGASPTKGSIQIRIVV